VEFDPFPEVADCCSISSVCGGIITCFNIHWAMVVDRIIRLEEYSSRLRECSENLPDVNSLLDDIRILLNFKWKI
jgi:hypothetical protein